MDDRHARHRRRPTDERRRPADGYRVADQRRFDRLVRDALGSLPPAVLAHLDGVELRVAETPPNELPATGEAGVALASYQTSSADPRRAPRRADRLVLYRRPLEARSRSRPELLGLLQRVIVHEVAHHLGIDDEGLDELGWS